jgi:DNA-binding transcriptional ArsR family regulator
MYWADKGHNPMIISTKMESYFRSSGPSYSWVPKWLRALKRSENIFEPRRRSGMPQDPLTGLKVLEFLNSTPFASICQIATATKMSRSAVLLDYSKG